MRRGVLPHYIYSLAFHISQRFADMSSFRASLLSKLHAFSLPSLFHLFSKALNARAAKNPAFQAHQFSTLKHSFSNREIEVIRMIAEGQTSKEIAKALYLSPATVRTHRQNILAKSGCSKSSELISYCYQQGIL